MPAVREPALLQSHWCRRCENQYCYSITGARTSTVTVALVPAVREPILLQSHWCENQHCYSRTGARTSTVTVALVPAVREPALLQSHWCENQHCYSRTGAKTGTVTVALVREPALLQSYWCENQHCCSRTGARTSTIAEQYWSLPWDRQAVTVTLRATLTTRHGTSAKPVQMVMQGKKPKVVVQQKWRTAPALPSGWVGVSIMSPTEVIVSLFCRYVAAREIATRQF